MPAIAERQVNEAAALLSTLMRQDEREFPRNAFLQQTGEPLEPVGKLVGFTRNSRDRTMDHRAMQMIVESHSKEPATRITEPRDAEVKGQPSRNGHEIQFLGLR